MNTIKFKKNNTLVAASGGFIGIESENAKEDYRYE